MEQIPGNFGLNDLGLLLQRIEETTRTSNQALTQLQSSIVESTQLDSEVKRAFDIQGDRVGSLSDNLLLKNQELALADRTARNNNAELERRKGESDEDYRLRRDAERQSRETMRQLELEKMSLQDAINEVKEKEVELRNLQLVVTSRSQREKELMDEVERLDNARKQQLQTARDFNDQLRRIMADLGIEDSDESEEEEDEDEGSVILVDEKPQPSENQLIVVPEEESGEKGLVVTNPEEEEAVPQPKESQLIVVPAEESGESSLVVRNPEEKEEVGMEAAVPDRGVSPTTPSSVGSIAREAKRYKRLLHESMFMGDYNASVKVTTNSELEPCVALSMTDYHMNTLKDEARSTVGILFKAQREELRRYHTEADQAIVPLSGTLELLLTLNGEETPLVSLTAPYQLRPTDESDPHHLFTHPLFTLYGKPIASDASQARLTMLVINAAPFPLPPSSVQTSSQ